MMLMTVITWSDGGNRSWNNKLTFSFLPDTRTFLPFAALAFSSSDSNLRNSGASLASTAARSLMSCGPTRSGSTTVVSDARASSRCWTYVSVAEQPLDHRVVMSRKSLCFQHQVETDVGAVTVRRETSMRTTTNDQVDIYGVSCDLRGCTHFR